MAKQSFELKLGQLIVWSGWLGSEAGRVVNIDYTTGKVWLLDKVGNAYPWNINEDDFYHEEDEYWILIEDVSEIVLSEELID